MSPTVTAPLVSVVIPLFRSERTLRGCLEALSRQTFQDFEVVLVDSSPEDLSAGIVRAALPDAAYLHVNERLLPQAARNLGAARAQGALLAFTDPDIYPASDWLEQLVAAWGDGHRVVLGSIACFGHRWFDRGVHLCKFSICLPGGAPRTVPLGWSGNVLVERGLFESLGGWDPAHVQGDAVFTARLRRSGHELWFKPLAVVAHDHGVPGWREFLRERFRRGREFAALESAGQFAHATSPVQSAPARVLRLALIPARVARRVLHIGRVAAGADLLRDFVVTLPVVVAGVGAWYAGLGAGYCRRPLVRRASA